VHVSQPPVTTVFDFFPLTTLLPNPLHTYAHTHAHLVPILSLLALAPPGNAARFVNHSCDPNLLPLAVRTGSPIPRIGFFAARPIAAGEELCISYGCTRSGDEAGGGSHGQGGGGEADGRRPCFCGAVTCCGVLPFDQD